MLNMTRKEVLIVAVIASAKLRKSPLIRSNDRVMAMHAKNRRHKSNCNRLIFNVTPQGLEPWTY